MSCGKNCKCKCESAKKEITCGSATDIKPMHAEAHKFASKELGKSFIVSNIDEQTYIELCICAELPEITAMFPIDMSGDKEFCVYVPDYIADLNEELLMSIDVVPVIVDDVEYEDDCEDIEDDFDYDEDAEEDEEDCYEDEVTADDELSETTKILETLRAAHRCAHNANECCKKQCKHDDDMEEFELAMRLMIGDIVNKLKAKAKDTQDKEPACDSPVDGAICITNMPKEMRDALLGQLGFEALCKDEAKKPQDKQPRNAARWSVEDVNLLMAASKKFRGKNGNICWEAVAKATGRSAEACRNKYGRLSSLA